MELMEQTLQLLIRDFHVFPLCLLLPTVTLGCQMASWVLECSNCGLPFHHSVIEATTMNFFFPAKPAFRFVEANFNAPTVGKARRISALTLCTGLEKASLLGMLIGNGCRVGQILGF